MPLEVPFQSPDWWALGERYTRRQIGGLFNSAPGATTFGKEGNLTGDAGCGCNPMWWLLAAFAGGAALGALAKGDQRKKKRKE